VVTGTPISSKMDEIRGLTEFLDLRPFYSKRVWQALLAAPYSASAAAGLASMRQLLQVGTLADVAG
jgi:hypothetical protein